MSSGSGKYYLDLAREDYYLKGGEPKGQWFGKGATFLALSGDVGTRQFEAVFKGYSPEGKALTQNAGEKKRQPGWDLTFSAPKSVSVLWGHADQAVQQQIQEAHRCAVEAALKYLEDEVSFSRRGKGGATIQRAGLVVATFEHGVSRELDPQLHTHALVMNASVRADGTTGTVLSKPFYQHKMAAGALYRAELASQLEERVGVRCERDKNSFTLANVPKTLCDIFSKRRHQIEGSLNSRGNQSARASAIATLETRRTKQNTPPRSKLFEEWKKEGQDHGFEGKNCVDRRRQSHDADKALTRSLKEASRNILEAHSHFDKRLLLKQVAIFGQTRNLSAKSIRDEVNQASGPKGKLVALGVTDGEERFTTTATLKLEKRLLARGDALHKTMGHGAFQSTINRVLERYSQARSPIVEEAKHHLKELVKAVKGQSGTAVDRQRVRKESAMVLNDEQKDAVRYLTTGKGAGLRVLEGFAGTGKTSALKAAREIWEESSYRVVGVALGGKAAKELETGSGIRSYTYAMLDRMMHPSVKDVLRHEMRQLGRAVIKRPTFGMNPFALDAKTVLVIDEASMISTFQMNSLLSDASRAGSKVVMLGDRTQLSAIGPGGAFGFLADRYGKTELKQIVRQNEEWMRDAVRQLAKGDSAGALKQFELAGKLRIKESRDAAISALVSDWAKSERGRERESLIFVGTRREAHDINTRCQKKRLESGDLSRGDALTVRASGVTDPNSKERVAFKVHRCDRVLLAKPSRAIGVVNGDTGTVLAVKKGFGVASDSVRVKLDSGKSVTIPLRTYDGVRLGYSVTTHKGQGSTVERAYILAGGAMTSKQLSYVQASRARDETVIYTDRKEAGKSFENLAKQMKTDREKTLATAVKENEKQSSMDQEALEREAREQEMERSRQRERKR